MAKKNKNNELHVFLNSDKIFFEQNVWYLKKNLNKFNYFLVNENTF